MYLRRGLKARRSAAGTAARLAFVSALLGAGAASACVACFGDPDSAQTQGMNAAMGVMLGVLGLVLAGFGYGAARVVRAASEGTGGGAPGDGKD